MSETNQWELDAIYQRNTLEWFALRNRFDQDVKYKQGKELLDWKRQELKELMELLRQHKRHLDYLAGEKIEPETHYGEAVLIGTMDGIA